MGQGSVPPSGEKPGARRKEGRLLGQKRSTNGRGRVKDLR